MTSSFKRRKKKELNTAKQLSAKYKRERKNRSSPVENCVSSPIVLMDLLYFFLKKGGGGGQLV
jgi:hypothetical protein